MLNQSDIYLSVNAEKLLLYSPPICVAHNLLATLTKPKSVIMAFPFSKKIFLVFKSLWIMPRWCKYPIPCAICWATSMILLRENLTFLKCKCVYKVFPLHKLVTMANLGGFMQAPINKMTFSCRVFLKVATSWRNASRVAASSFSSFVLVKSHTFIATSPHQCPRCTVKIERIDLKINWHGKKMQNILLNSNAFAKTLRSPISELLCNFEAFCWSLLWTPWLFQFSNRHSDFFQLSLKIVQWFCSTSKVHWLVSLG